VFNRGRGMRGRGGRGEGRGDGGGRGEGGRGGGGRGEGRLSRMKYMCWPGVSEVLCRRTILSQISCWQAQRISMAMPR